MRKHRQVSIRFWDPAWAQLRSGLTPHLWDQLVRQLLDQLWYQFMRQLEVPLRLEMKAFVERYNEEA